MDNSNPFKEIFDELEQIKALLQQQQNHFNAAPKEQTEEEYLTRKEVSALLKISLVTLNDWTSQGVIPAYKIGTRVRYRKSDVIDALQKKETYHYR